VVLGVGTEKLPRPTAERQRGKRGKPDHISRLRGRCLRAHGYRPGQHPKHETEELEQEPRANPEQQHKQPVNYDEDDDSEDDGRDNCISLLRRIVVKANPSSFAQHIFAGGLPRIVTVCWLIVLDPRGRRERLIRCSPAGADLALGTPLVFLVVKGCL
jgi:hypothetical protein